MSVYDILWVGDLRFTGGTGTAIAEEISASIAAGYRCGLIPMRSSILAFPHPINPRIRAFIDRGDVDLLDPRESVACRLCCLYHPQSFTHFPSSPPRIDAAIKLLIATHPPFEGDGTTVYDAAAIDRHVQEILGGGVLWAPVGPAVRRQLCQLMPPLPLLDSDWVGVIDTANWQIDGQGALEGQPVLGRHSRPDAAKWPDTREQVLTVYPDCPEITVKVLGDGPFLRDLVSPMPVNWQVFAFNQLTPLAFLRQIGVFVYFHHSRWVEAFGYAILEALAARVPVILPRHFEALFGTAAVYAEPRDVRAMVENFYTKPSLYNEQCAHARELVGQRFGQGTHRARVEALIGPPGGNAVPVARQDNGEPTSKTSKKTVRGRRRVLFMSSNGVGMGHLTRLLAMARRLPPTMDRIFLTMSRAARHVQDFGFPVEYLPFHGYLGCDIRLWNHHLRQDLTERFAFYRPDVVVFDGNVPYDGLINAMASTPATPLVWSRRSMWTEGAGRDHIWRERFADAVIEPAEIAGDLDRGLTTDYRGKTRKVDPVLLLDRQELLTREQARSELGLAQKRPTCLVQLGAGNNFDTARLRGAVLDSLLQRPDLQIVWLDWAIAENEIELPSSIRRIKTYPLARYLNAFDVAVSAAGYNAYHELLSHGLPTLFVPNEHPMMDDQLARAYHAELHGLGLMLRRRDCYRVEETVGRLLDPEEQIAIRNRCAKLAFGKGAFEAARILEEMAYTCRADLDPASDIIPALRRFGG